MSMTFDQFQGVFSVHFRQGEIKIFSTGSDPEWTQAIENEIMGSIDNALRDGKSGDDGRLVSERGDAA